MDFEEPINVYFQHGRCHSKTCYVDASIRVNKNITILPLGDRKRVITICVEGAYYHDITVDVLFAHILHAVCRIN